MMVPVPQLWVCMNSPLWNQWHMLGPDVFVFCVMPLVHLPAATRGPLGELLLAGRGTRCACWPGTACPVQLCAEEL